MGISSLDNGETPPEHFSRQTGPPEIDALEGLSDRELLEGGGGVLHRIALHGRYDTLVQKQLAVPSTRRGLSQQVWMTAFDEWNVALEKRLSVPEWLEQIVEQTLKIGRDVRGEETYLPDPFAWYLRRALEALPPVSRLLLLLVEVEHWPEEQIARFLSERGTTVPAAQVPLLYGQAGQQLLAGLPVELHEIYFRGALDCLSLVPWLYPSAEAEIRLFEEQRREAPEATRAKPSRTQTPAPARSGLVLAGVVAICALVGGLGVRYLYQSSRDTPPTLQQPKPGPPTAAPVAVAPPARKALPPVLETGSTPSALAFPAGRGPLFLLVRPGSDGLRRLRRIEPRVFYRQYQGQPYVQVGVYSSERQARLTATELSKLGFTVVLTR